jgi:hypothetical protein
VKRRFGADVAKEHRRRQQQRGGGQGQQRSSFALRKKSVLVQPQEDWPPFQGGELRFHPCCSRLAACIAFVSVQAN